MFERLRASWALSNNLRQLWFHESRDTPLDGLRALSILWVTLFHAAFYAVWYVPRATYGELLRSPWMRFVWRGDFGVDMFFVLSGFLIATMLLDELAANGNVQLGLFEVRRFLRTWPTLFVAVVLDLVLFGDHPDVAWAPLVYVENFMSVAHVCMGWTWSLSIEEQFYLLCPWILFALFRLSISRRIAVLGAGATALAILNAGIVIHHGYHPFDADIVINRPLGRWIFAYDDLYTKTWTRAGPLLAGIGAAFLHRDRRFEARLARARVGGSVAFVAAILAAWMASHWPFANRAQRWIEVLYLATFRPVFGIAVAVLMLLSLSNHPIGRVLGRFLSLRIFYPISQLAYSAYLLNPMVTTCVDRSIFPWVALHPVRPLLVYVPLDVIGTFAAAAVLHLAVERPILRLRPRPAVSRSS